MREVQRREARTSSSHFWRLLSDYESSSRDETTALRAQDFETVATIQALKAVILAAMEQSGREIGIDRRQASLHERLEKIAAGERANHAFVTELLTGNSAERITLKAARSRLRALLHSYVLLDPPSGGSFLARG